MSFAQWLDDWRWAANMRRVRAYRRTLLFSKRAAFDKAIRPVAASILPSYLPRPDEGSVIDYPDAIYYIGIGDVIRAMLAANTNPSGPPTMTDPKDELPRLKPAAGELTVECPKCHQRVSETCCAFQDYEYYKDCYCYLTREKSAAGD